MSNMIWYIGTAVIFFGIAVYTIYSIKDTYKVSTLILFYIFSSSITWIGEFIVLGLFNSYAYKTGLFEDPWAQNLIGHLFLNTTMFPAAAIVLLAFSFRYSVMAIIAVIFVLVEYFFSKYGLYEQHWWRYYMSIINIVIFMLIVKKWFSKLISKCYGVIRTITLYFVLLVLIHIAEPILLLMGKLHFELGFVNKLFGNFYLSSIIIAFTHHLIISCVIVFFVCVLKKWYWKIAPFVISISVLTIYWKMHILVIDNGWNLIYYLIIQQFIIALFILIRGRFC